MKPEEKAAPSEYLKGWKGRDQRRLLEGEIDPTVGIICGLCPNLERLTVPYVRKVGVSFPRLVGEMRTLVLLKVRDVEEPEETDEGYSINALAPLFPVTPMLETVRFVDAGKCKDLKGFRLENVNNLDLMMGVLNAKSLGNVFRMLPGLENFNHRSAFQAREDLISFTVREATKKILGMRQGGGLKKLTRVHFDMRLCDPLFCWPRDDEYDEDLGYQEAEEVDLDAELAYAKKVCVEGASSSPFRLRHRHAKARFGSEVYVSC